MRAADFLDLDSVTEFACNKSAIGTVVETVESEREGKKSVAANSDTVWANQKEPSVTISFFYIKM